MGADFEIVSEAQALGDVARSLGFATTPSKSDFLFELLRGATWALTSGDRPVHVGRLINRVISAGGFAEAGNEQALRDELHQDLGALLDAGDLVEFTGGLWLPAFSRLVSLDTSGGYLLVGGVPTGLLGFAGVQSIERHGPFRRIRNVATVSGLQFMVETVESWARLPTESLREWADALLSISFPTYVEPKDGSPLHIYAPELSKRRAPQFKRWRDNAQGCHGRYLARRTRVYGAREYRLVDVSNGIVQRAGALLASGESRRLMYAADLQAANPVVVTWSENAGTTEFITQSELPRAEQRLFAALGTVSINPARVYEQRWMFNTSVELVFERLRALSIDVQNS